MHEPSAYDDILAAVPEWDGFPPLDRLEAATDALADAHPPVTVRQCGVSRAGHPIRCVEAGEGPLHALLVGLPHPEEPVGTLLIGHLLEQLATTDLADRLGFRFSVVEAADPDGAKLNEPWFDAPGDLERVLLGLYRPATGDQVEWAFPFSYKGYAFSRPLPEAAAVMSVIDRAPVDVVMSLHNSAFSGAYFYVTEADDALVEALAAVAGAAGLPLQCGEPEVPYLETFGDGVFRDFGLREEYDYLESFGQMPAVVLDSGTSSNDYAARRWGSFSLTAEVPMFTSARIADTAPAGISRAEAKLRGIEVEQEHLDWLRRRFPEAAAELTRETPWLRSVRSYVTHAKTDLEAERRLVRGRREFAAEATVAQLFDSVYLRELSTLPVVGRFAAMAAVEAESSAVLEKAADEARERVRERAARLAVAGGLAAVPLRAAVQVQLGALLATLDHVRDRYRLEHPRPASVPPLAATTGDEPAAPL